MRRGIVDKDIWKIGIWYNQNTKQFYYRLYSGFFHEKEGFVNSYGHKLLFVIDIYKDVVKPKNIPIFIRILKKFISFLQKLDNKLSRKYILFFTLLVRFMF